MKEKRKRKEEKGGGETVRKKKRVCRYRLSAFGEFYKIHQEVLETEGTMALTVVVKETPLRDFSLQNS